MNTLADVPFYHHIYGEEPDVTNMTFDDDLCEDGELGCPGQCERGFKMPELDP